MVYKVMDMEKTQGKSLQYTVKIYGEGFTEWFYFEGLRTGNRFSFSMVPDMPKNSRSSYKRNLKLIDKELKLNKQERADAIFLVIDTDTLVKDKKQFAVYQAAKEKYKKDGVIFIESHPCIELWFLYHLMKRFGKTNYETYEALRPSIEAVLPGYEKTGKYYQTDRHFKEHILNNPELRRTAIKNAISSCKYEPVDEREVVNHTELFKAIHFFRLMQKFSEIQSLLKEVLRSNINLQHEIEDHKSLKVFVRKDKPTLLCLLKYQETQMKCVLPDGNSYMIDDAQRLAAGDEIIQALSLSIKKLVEI